MGAHGALILLILLFMATTSSTSAEIIAASSIWTFDVYKSYINPTASSNKLVQISMWALGGYSLVLAGFSCLFNGVGVSLGWLSTCAAVLVGSGAAPLMFILLWDRTSTAAAIFGPVIGFFGGMIGWFVTAYKLNGAVTVATTLSTYNIVAGDVAAIVISTLATVILTFVFPHIKETTTPEEEYPEKPTGYVTTTPVNNAGDSDDIQEAPSLHGEYEFVPRQAVTAKEANAGFWKSYISLNVFAIIFLVVSPKTCRISVANLKF
jgi:Na+/proline symporter